MQEKNQEQPPDQSEKENGIFGRGNEKRRMDLEKETDIDNQERGTEDESSNIYT